MIRPTTTENDLRIMNERIAEKNKAQLQASTKNQESIPKITKKNKFRNIKTVIDGITFDSKKESARYLQLKTMQNGGLIKELKTHVPFELIVNGVLICRYTPDFTYYEKDADSLLIVEDVKSKITKTPQYNLKKRLMKAIHGIEIKET